MIPGVLRGVIASSWLRAADDLRAPNAITTGQNIPKVFVRQIGHQQSEFNLEFHSQPLVIQRRGAQMTANALLALQQKAPLKFGANVLLVIRKV